MVADADIARSAHSPLDLDDAAPGRGQRRRPGRSGPGCRQPGQVGGVQPGRQGLDPVAIGQDMHLPGPGPDPRRAAGHGRAEPDLLPGDLQVARRWHHPAQFHRPGSGLLLLGQGRSGRWPFRRDRVAGCRSRGSGRGKPGGHPQRQNLPGSRGEPGGGTGHPQGLVRPVGVVLLAPRIDSGLSLLDAGERLVLVQQLQLQGLGRVGRAARCQRGLVLFRSASSGNA